jgi:hypothetical protein
MGPHHRMSMPTRPSARAVVAAVAGALLLTAGAPRFVEDRIRLRDKSLGE